MRCTFCGGTTKRGVITFHDEEEGRFILVEHVPAEVCSSCGEATFSPEVADKLLQFARQRFAPGKTIEIPVFDFAQTS